MADENHFLAYIKESVTILRPHKSTLPRGNASPVENQPTVSIRLQEEPKQAIDDACTILDMHRSEFLRWCGYQVALDILRQKADYDKRILKLKTPL